MIPCNFSIISGTRLTRRVGGETRTTNVRLSTCSLPTGFIRPARRTFRRRIGELGRRISVIGLVNVGVVHRSMATFRLGPRRVAVRCFRRRFSGLMRKDHRVTSCTTRCNVAAAVRGRKFGIRSDSQMRQIVRRISHPGFGAALSINGFLYVSRSPLIKIGGGLGCTTAIRLGSFCVHPCCRGPNSKM